MQKVTKFSISQYNGNIDYNFTEGRNDTDFGIEEYFFKLPHFKR